MEDGREDGEDGIRGEGGRKGRKNALSSTHRCEDVFPIRSDPSLCCRLQ